jgi:hypothetical protein
VELEPRRGGDQRGVEGLADIAIANERDVQRRGSCHPSVLMKKAGDFSPAFVVLAP